MLRVFSRCFSANYRVVGGNDNASHCLHILLTLIDESGPIRLNFFQPLSVDSSFFTDSTFPSLHSTTFFP